MRTSDTIAEIAKALNQFQSDVKQPEKSAENPYFKSKYVKLSQVITTFQKYGTKHGLSFIQYPVNGEHSIGVETLIMHVSGEWIKFDPFFLPIEKATAQGAGSATTYAKRYALSAALGIDSDEDDDGNQASQRNNGNQSQNEPRGQQSNVSNMTTHTASGKQIGLIKGLWKGSGGDSKSLDPWVKGKYKKPLDKLTTHEASGLIEKLQKRQNKKAEQKQEDADYSYNTSEFPPVEGDAPF
ncbi:ERF family protein [Sporolactobacillus terrae]|uniref:ERF family protein n=1 Tax=Sporolactobacillus terrae TaxID=269673 RepID=UPI000685DB80|nr:ERF family protein [Sporolactobacillus terrae]